MPWMHHCKAIPKSAHRSQMVLIRDEQAELCGRCGEYRHAGRMVAVPVDGGPMIDPAASEVTP